MPYMTEFYVPQNIPSWRRLALPFTFLLLLLSDVSYSKSDQDISQRHEPVTTDLISLVEHNAEFKSLLIKSIDLAKKENSNRQTNPAQNLDEFYSFIDWASHCMPWNILKDQNYPLIYEQIDQSLNYFYFVIDRPLTELEGKGLSRNSLQYYEPFRSWLIRFVKSWGTFLSTPDSWNNNYYLKAFKDKRFGLEKGWYEDPTQWTNFNQFFARYLKSPNQRPIAKPDNPGVVVSPADAYPQGVWDIDSNSNLVNKDGVNVKSSVFYSIRELLGTNSAYKDSFANGLLTHTFLDVQDYHRYHFPLAGTIKEMKIISQDVADGGIIYWSPKKKKYLADATIPDWQFIETRGYVIIQTEKFGLVAILPVGMSQVSSVNFEKDVQVGSTFKKGDMLGYFLFGGSDIVMLFQKKAGFKLTAPSNGQHLNMGEKFGICRPPLGKMLKGFSHRSSK